MSGSLKKFDIKLDNSTAVFSPGSLITGQVILDLYRTKVFRALKLRFKGRCRVHWTESTGSGKDSRSESYTGQEEYFRSDIYLHESAGGDSTELSAGNHVFPFSFSLPQNIPSSFEHHVGFVRYSIKAIIDRPWKFDHETKIIITVRRPLTLVPHQIQQGIDDEFNESYCCVIMPCINQGNMNFRIQVPRTGYTCGDPIEVKISIDNKSDSVDVTRISLGLEQKLKFHSRSPHKTKKLTEVVQKSKKMGPFAKKVESQIGLQVPNLPLSHLSYCTLIDVEYEIVINIHVSGLHCSTKKRYDVLIGTIPSTTPGFLPSNAPTAPFDYSTSTLLQNPTIPFYPVPPASSIDSPPFPYPPHMPDQESLPPSNIGFIYPNPSAPAMSIPELPPPSYESVMAENYKK